MNNFESLQTGSVRKKVLNGITDFRIKDQDGNWKMHEFKGGQTKAETTFMLKQALEEYRQLVIVVLACCRSRGTALGICRPMQKLKIVILPLMAN